jgi:hypothetical protein
MWVGKQIVNLLELFLGLANYDITVDHEWLSGALAPLQNPDCRLRESTLDPQRFSSLPVVQAEQTRNDLSTHRSCSPKGTTLLYSIILPMLLPAAISKLPIGLAAKFTESSKQHNSGARHQRLDGTLTRLLCVCSSTAASPRAIGPSDRLLLPT